MAPASIRILKLASEPTKWKTASESSVTSPPRPAHLQAINKPKMTPVGKQMSMMTSCVVIAGASGSGSIRWAMPINPRKATTGILSARADHFRIGRTLLCRVVSMVLDFKGYSLLIFMRFRPSSDWKKPASINARSSFLVGVM